MARGEIVIWWERGGGGGEDGRRRRGGKKKRGSPYSESPLPRPILYKFSFGGSKGVVRRGRREELFSSLLHLENVLE